MRQPILLSLLLLSLTACSESSPDADASKVSPASSSTTVAPAIEPVVSTVESSPLPEVAEVSGEAVAVPELVQLPSDEVLQQVVEQKAEQAKPELSPVEAKPVAAVQLVSAQTVPMIGAAIPNDSIEHDVVSQQILDEQAHEEEVAITEVGRFEKLDSQGRVLFGEAKSWSCVVDHRSGLMWENKLANQQRAAQHTYSLRGDGGECGLDRCTIERYVQQLNELALCGRSDWRVPSKNELLRLVDYSQPPSEASIDGRYFSNTQRGRYWSTDQFEYSDKYHWSVNFKDGINYIHHKNNRAHLRLVSGH